MKALVPKRVREGIRAAHRSLVFRSAMSRYLRELDRGSVPEGALLAELVYGWGNAGWSARGEYLTACVQHALAADGPVLECGSGLSTLLIGSIAQRRGLAHHALEHHPGWAETVQESLDRYKIESVVVHTAPLKDYGRFAWYDPPLDALADHFALVLCDGPPSETKGGRSGLLPVLRDRIGPGSVLLIDDVTRSHEAELARCWKVELGAASQRGGRDQPFIALTVPSEPGSPDADA